MSATVKGFLGPFSILIDSGVSAHYVPRCSLEGIQRCHEALRAQESDNIAVRLAIGARLTTAKVSLKLRVKYLDFGIIEHGLVLA